MKILKKANYLIILILMASCGGGDDGPAPEACTTNSNLVGQWANTKINETLTIDSACVVKSDYCDASYSIVNKPTTSPPNFNVDVTATSPVLYAGCIPSDKTYACIYNVVKASDGVTEVLTFGCPSLGSVQQYIKLN
jgi:hypothetical protein